MRIKFFSQQADTKIINLMKAFWFYGRFSEAMLFSKFALLFQKSQLTYQKFSIVWLPQTNTAWIKRSIPYITL